MHENVVRVKRKMGKYMKKYRGMGEVAVMEVVSQVGVRTRARTLAAAAASATSASSSSSSSLQRSNGEFQVKYLELRSRRLVVTIVKEKQGELNSRLISSEKAENSDRIPADRRDSRSSSYASSKFVRDADGNFLELEETRRNASSLDLAGETCLGENLMDIDCRERREATPSSNLRVVEFSEALESTTKPGEAISGDAICRKLASGDDTKLPPMEEIEEFFAAAEKEEQKRFAQKYNYDMAKDVPMAGRYEWVRLKP